MVKELKETILKEAVMTVCHQIENINNEIRDIKSQMEVPEMKNTITGMKSSLRERNRKKEK